MPHLPVSCSQDHSLESQSEMERIIRDLNGGEPSHVALFWLCAIFGLALLTIVLYSKLKQRGDAGEPHPSVEETHPQLGPYNPTYD